MDNKLYRTFRINEYSQRYSEAIDSFDSTNHDLWRVQSKNNKQGSAGYLPDEWTYELIDRARMYTPEYANYVDSEFIELYPTPGKFLSYVEEQTEILARAAYEQRLAFGIAREQARKCMPVSNYTRIQLNADLHNLLHCLHQRLDSHAQEEIREMAICLNQIVKAWCPIAWQAHQDYVINAMVFSFPELEVLRWFNYDIGRCYKDLMSREKADIADFLETMGLNSKTERIDFMAKLKRLVGDQHGSH